MSRRQVVLWGVLVLVAIGAVAFHIAGPRMLEMPNLVRAEEPPIPGVNSISGLVIGQVDGSVRKVEFDYFYTGNPSAAQLSVELTPQRTGSPVEPLFSPYGRLITLGNIMRGAHHARMALNYPGSAMTTVKVAALMRSWPSSPKIVASQSLDVKWDWPDYPTWWSDKQISVLAPEKVVEQAVALIDTDGEEQLHAAKLLLERLLARNPRMDPAYVELARVIMKTNWSPAGLHEAEALLHSALQIRPDNADAKIRLAYVLTHERQFAKAEALFEEVSSADTHNLWLWTRWGELLMLEGRPDQAIARFRQAIESPIQHNTYDRARDAAYKPLIDLLLARSDLDGVEALYKKRIDEYGPGSCNSAEYSAFLLRVRRNAEAAIDLATRALNHNCDDSRSREILGLAHYVKWSQAQGEAATDSLNQARIYLPAGAKALYLMAGSDITAAAARKLIASGEGVDQKDNEGMTALALALQEKDLAAVKRLLALGARTDVAVGSLAIPVALLPVLEGDADAIRLLRRQGVNYARLKFRGASAVDIARQSGSRAALEALGNNEAVL